MKNKFFALVFVWALALCGAATAQQTAQTDRLVNSLPASDGAVTLNVKRLLSEALPQTLSGNQPMLADVLRKIDEVKNKTGVDLRQFDQIAVGVSTQKSAAGELDFEPVVLARGSYSAASFVTLAKIAANSKYREERVGSRSVYIFSPRQLLKSVPGSTNAAPKNISMIERALDRLVNNLTNELAVTVFDNNTLAIGSVARMRQTLGASPRVGGEVLDLVSRKPNAVMNFSLRLPGGLSSFIKLENDELGKTLDSVRFIAGAVDVSDGSAVVSLAAKTAGAEQAASFQEQLEGFQNLGKIFLGGSKGADKQLYARLIENVKINREGNAVLLDVQVPQSDINFLLDKFAWKKDRAASAK